MADFEVPDITLTETDRLILEGYKAMVEAIGQVFGSTCEVVLHSLADLSHSVICIHNGEKTGRKVGSPVTDKALNILKECGESGAAHSSVYFTQTAQGHTMRSTTTVIKGTGGYPIGLLCINFDLSTPFNELAAQFTQPCSASPDSEHFAIDFEDLVLTKVRKIEAEVKSDPSIPVRQKTHEIIVRLHDEGVFKLRKSVPRIAEILSVSRDVIYMHLRALKESRERRT